MIRKTNRQSVKEAKEGKGRESVAFWIGKF